MADRVLALLALVLLCRSPLLHGWLPLLLSVLMGSGCGLPSKAALDLTPPRVLGSSLRTGRDLIPTDAIRIELSEPLDPRSVLPDAVRLFPYELLGPCRVDLACAEGRCHRGRCQRDPLTPALTADLAHPPLSPERLALVAPTSLRLEESGRQLTLEPLDPLPPDRLHVLVVSSSLQDVAANPIEVEPASGLALRQDFTTGPAEDGRAVLHLLSPPDGAVEVPPNLRAAVVVFSRLLLGVQAGSLWLQQEDGTRLPSEVQAGTPRCQAQLPGTCYEVRPLVPLPPLERIEVHASDELRDVRGRPPLQGVPRAFATAAAPDCTPPRVIATQVRVSDRCAVVRLLADEPVNVRLQPGWGLLDAWSLGVLEHELALPAPPVSPGVLRVSLEDLAGNQAELPPRTLEPGDRSPRVAISEVLANPAGLEPAQEYVELINLSGAPVQLAGWSLDDNDDGIGREALPDAVLGPGQLAVVVGVKYSASSAADPPPAPDALLVRLAGTLGEAGLANSGELLTLRDPEGRLVSSWNGRLPAGKASNGRSVERVRPDACDVGARWRLEPHGSSTPGAQAR